MTKRFVSVCCQGEHCWCGRPAEHKVEEVIFDDDPTAWYDMPLAMTDLPDYGPVQPRRIMARHPLTSYICHEHFVQLMGAAADRELPYNPPSRLLP